MLLSEFKVHDVSHFPAVLCKPEQAYPGYGCQWRCELEALLERDEPFFMVFNDGDYQEAPEDTRLRAIWLKENKQCLSRLCKSIVSVTPDAQQRCKMEAQCAGLSKAFGIPRMVASDAHEANTLGWQTL